MTAERNKFVFIVEDSAEIQYLLARLLKREGYVVECASNGREAIEKLRSGAATPGLILLDLMMPDMDGYQFREEQGKHPKIESIPVVVMTADGDIQTKSARIGAHGYLKKPFLDVDSILKIIGGFFTS
jgi:two-component system response regulator MprA